MKVRSATWLVAFALAAPELRADETSRSLSTLASGDRVRLRFAGSDDTVQATVETAVADDLVLRRSGVSEPLRLSVAQLQSLDVVRGRSSYWRRGAVIGFVPGALFFGALGGSIPCDPYASGPCFYPALAIITGVFGGAATAGVGALVGLAFKTDRWVRVHERKPKVALKLVPTKGELRASLSVSF